MPPTRSTPRITRESVDENSDKGTLVGAPVTTTDSNGDDVLYYTIPDASDSNPFAIDKKSGQITVDGTVHFEATGTNGPAYQVTVTATDPSGVNSEITITITAKDVNEKPTVEEDGSAVKTTEEIDSTPPDPGVYAYVSDLREPDIHEGVTLTPVTRRSSRWPETTWERSTSPLTIPTSRP